MAQGREQAETTRTQMARAREAMEQQDGRIRSVAAATEKLGYTASNVSSDVQQVANIAPSHDRKGGRG